MSGTCGGNSAINTVAQGGKVTCHATLPPEFGAASDSAAVPTTSATVVSKLLPGGNYLLNSNVYATISGGTAGQQVSVACTLQVASGSSQTRTVSVEIGPKTQTQRVAIPLTFPAAVASPQGTGARRLRAHGVQPDDAGPDGQRGQHAERGRDLQQQLVGH